MCMCNDCSKLYNEVELLDVCVNAVFITRIYKLYIIIRCVHKTSAALSLLWA